MVAHRQPAPGLLIYALLSRDQESEGNLLRRLQEQHGPLALLSPPHDFPWSHYYRNEVGEHPIRRYVTTAILQPREELHLRKLWSIQLEAELSENGKRTTNIDPGCLTLGHLFLASTKDHKQRVYMGQGIYIEPTCYFADKKWQRFPWSYPDFFSPVGVEWLSNSRALLQKMLSES